MKNAEKLKWTSTQVADFWNFIENSEVHREQYFTKFYGENIINFLNYLVSFEGEILDYGCGFGYLTEKLLQQGISCHACDFSESAVELVNQKFENDILWKGAKHIKSSTLPYADNSIDLIICIETIEHILDEFLEETLQEFQRVLKPKTGRLFITTPNNENLDQGLIYCPNCHTLFHYYQHIRSFNIETLSELMNQYNFQTHLCSSTSFDEFKLYKMPHILDWSIRQWRYIIRQAVINYIDYVDLYKTQLGLHFFRKRLSEHQPHLFWLGGKD